MRVACAACKCVQDHCRGVWESNTHAGVHASLHRMTWPACAKSLTLKSDPLKLYGVWMEPHATEVEISIAPVCAAEQCLNFQDSV